MTIIYNAHKHFQIIAGRHGSVWPKVLPFCVLNLAITAVIYWLVNNTEVDLTFNGGVGYRYISTLVAFFTITNLASSYGRFWEARGHLGTALFEGNMLAARAALYTAHDPCDKADLWRKALKNNLINLIDNALFMIQEGRASLFFNLMDPATKHIDWERHGLEKDEKLVRSVNSILEDKNVMGAAMKVDGVLLTAGDHVQGGCKNVGELHGRCAAIVGAYFNLIKFSTTPRPFVTEQMGRTLVLAWVLSLPGAIVATHKDEWIEAFFLVFMVTYGFLGLTFVDIELSDPLGNDDNDLETERYLKLIKCDIENLLGEKSKSSEGKLLAEAYHVSHGTGTYQST